MAVLSSDFLFWAAMKVVPDVLTKFVLATEPGLVHSALPEEQVRVSDVLKHILPVSLRAKGILFDARTAGAPSPMDLRSIRCPLLAISAEDDLYGTDLSARFTAGQVPDGKLVIYPTVAISGWGMTGKSGRRSPAFCDWSTGRSRVHEARAESCCRLFRVGVLGRKLPRRQP